MCLCKSDGKEKQTAVQAAVFTETVCKGFYHFPLHGLSCLNLPFLSAFITDPVWFCMRLFSLCTETAKNSDRSCEQPSADAFACWKVFSLCGCFRNDLAVITAAFWTLHNLSPPMNKNVLSSLHIAVWTWIHLCNRIKSSVGTLLFTVSYKTGLGKSFIQFLRVHRKPA